VGRDTATSKGEKLMGRRNILTLLASLLGVTTLSLAQSNEPDFDRGWVPIWKWRHNIDQKIVELESRIKQLEKERN
jgi:hypothetical protein